MMVFFLALASFRFAKNLDRVGRVGDVSVPVSVGMSNLVYYLSK